MTNIGDYNRYILRNISKIGIAISTRNRKEAFDKTLHNISLRLPENCLLITVDDASDSVVPSAFRFENQAGISRVKNKCIELLLDAGCEHLFLFDNDIYPIADNWHFPYTESEYKIMCYTWYKHLMNDGKHRYHIKGHGAMMYIHRDVIETIGGFDTDLYNKYEHTQLFERAHKAGFTPYYPFIDVVDSHKLFHSMDEHNEVERTMSESEIKELLDSNMGHYYKTRFSTEFIPYK